MMVPAISPLDKDFDDPEDDLGETARNAENLIVLLGMIVNDRFDILIELFNNAVEMCVVVFSTSNALFTFTLILLLSQHNTKVNTMKVKVSIFVEDVVILRVK